MKVQGLYMLERVKIILPCISGSFPELKISFFACIYKYMSSSTNTGLCLQNQGLSNSPLKVTYIQLKMRVIKLIAVPC